MYTNNDSCQWSKIVLCGNKGFKECHCQMYYHKMSNYNDIHAYQRVPCNKEFKEMGNSLNDMNISKSNIMWTL